MASPDQSPGVNGSSISDLGSPAIREARLSPATLPSRADIFIPPYSTDFPRDFREPPPYYLNAQEWDIYTGRKQAIEKVIASNGSDFMGES